MFLLNKLKDQDIIFFIVCLAIVVIIVAVWFLIPVFNKRQYADQRESLRKREAAFRSNIQAIKEQNNATNSQETTEYPSVAVSNAEVAEPNKEEEVTKEE